MFVFSGLFILYVVSAVIMIAKGTQRGINNQPKIKILVSILYLLLPVAAFLLNTIDGKLVAVQHFIWIFCAMLLMFVGDMLTLNGEGYREPFWTRIFYVLAYLTLMLYATLYLYKTAMYWVNIREGMIFINGVILSAILAICMRTKWVHHWIWIFIYLIIAVASVAKATSLIEFMNTNVSWPTFIGVLFFLIADILYIFESKCESGKFSIHGMALMFYYAGMAVLPFGIYYV